MSSSKQLKEMFANAGTRRRRPPWESWTPRGYIKFPPSRKTVEKRKARKYPQPENLEILTSAFQQITDIVPETIVELICIFSLHFPEDLFISPNKRAGATLLFKDGANVSFQTWRAYDKIMKIDWNNPSFDPSCCDVTGTYEVDLERTTWRELRIKATFIHLEMTSFTRFWGDWGENGPDPEKVTCPKTVHVMDICVPQNNGETAPNLYYQWKDDRCSDWGKSELEQDHEDHPFRGVLHHDKCPSELAQKYWKSTCRAPYLTELKAIHADAVLQDHQYEITWKSRPLGFAIATYRDRKNAYVASIQVEENISKGLTSASQIIRVNGLSMIGKNHDEIIEEMKTAKLPMTVRFMHRRFVRHLQNSSKNQIPIGGSVASLFSNDSDEIEKEVVGSTAKVASGGSTFPTEDEEDLPKWARFLMENN